jgi:hypothetical protein
MPMEMMPKGVIPIENSFRRWCWEWVEDMSKIFYMGD